MMFLAKLLLVLLQLKAAINCQFYNLTKDYEFEWPEIILFPPKNSSQINLEPYPEWQPSEHISYDDYPFTPFNYTGRFNSDDESENTLRTLPLDNEIVDFYPTSDNTFNIFQQILDRDSGIMMLDDSSSDIPLDDSDGPIVGLSQPNISSKKKIPTMAISSPGVMQPVAISWTLPPSTASMYPDSNAMMTSGTVGKGLVKKKRRITTTRPTEALARKRLRRKRPILTTTTARPKLRKRKTTTVESYRKRRTTTSSHTN
ncbi:uncharacterized protein LOC110674463 [Aedes aegypti]|uniref:Uncharacterized protein n=1 Tax=Aedes aegypti TaxID=7159 RepID=A0A6I8TY71_AEDAE|nr:uncharacterized protein LOC110674463 [Aedes aegypti]